MPDTITSATPDEMHEFRKAVITCRYQTAFFNGHHRVENSTLELSLEKLRKSLGKINDLYRLKTELFRCLLEMDLHIFNLLQRTIHQQEKSIRKSTKEIIEYYFLK